MKKKSVISIIAFVVVFAGVLGVYYWTHQDVGKAGPTQNIRVEAKIDEYETLQAIEEKVDIIVKVKKIDEENPIVWKDEQGNVFFVGTIGNTEVIRIYKDESDRNIKVGDILPIFENEAYDEKENKIYHVAGYQKMKIGNEYMLFLSYSDGDRWYVPCSAIWGKYPLNIQENILYSEFDNLTDPFDESIINKIGTEVLEKYQ